MAFKDASSPSNMTFASEDEDVLTNIEVWGVVMRNVDAKPDPPWVVIFTEEVLIEEAARVVRMAWSILDGILRAAR
jgi:hypothetical protein